MRRMMLVGRIGSGKTTLIQALLDREKSYRKTQAIDFQERYVDTPGEFLEHRRFFSALRASAGGCEAVSLIQSAADRTSAYPPNFSAMFNKPVFGVITKTDRPDADIERADRFLRRAGIERIYRTSALVGEGIEELRSAAEAGR